MSAPTEIGDNEFATLYAAHFDAPVRVAFLITGSNEIAEDVVQDVFLRCRSRLPELEHPLSYLRAAVVNACRSHHRRRQIAQRLPVDRVELGLPVELIEFRGALLSLPTRQRSAIVLRYVCDLPDDEIAERSTGTKRWSWKRPATTLQLTAEAASAEDTAAVRPTASSAEWTRKVIIASTRS